MREADSKVVITLGMLTRNEEDRVAASLGAVREHVARMVVVDAQSDDRTREIALSCGAEVVVRPWQGFVSARRFLLSLCETPWMLMIDADEVVEAGLWAELARIGLPDCAPHGFQLRRRTVYEGKKLLRAFQPDWKTALVRVDSAYFEDRRVHEALRVNGPLARLESEILHYSYRSAKDQYQRIDAYARLAAHDLAAQGKRAGFGNLWLRPAWRWFSQLVLKGGIIDGGLGVTMANRSAWDVHLRYRYLQRLRREH